MHDYHAQVEETYRSTLDALRAEGLSAEMIDTGGSCKAIMIPLSSGRHCLLTAGGPLADERDGSLPWDMGVYSDGECEEAFIVTLRPTDKPEEDHELATTVKAILTFIGGSVDQSQTWIVIVEAAEVDGVMPTPADVRERIEDEAGVSVREMYFPTRGA